jgi:AcrR family transcriptional regulator
VSEDETRQRILDAATQVFSEQGYRGATTRAIAIRAGINEVTLFRHFGNKESLFQAMIRRNSAAQGLETALREKLTGNYPQDLEVIAKSIITVMVARRREILTSLFEADRLTEMRDLIAFVPQQLRQMLGEYLLKQMGRGVVRPMDTEMAAQAFLGMFLAYSISLGLLPDGLSRKSLDEVAVEFVDLFLHGTIT